MITRMMTPAGVAGGQVGVGFRHAEQDLPLVGLGAAQRERDRQPAQRAHQVQAQPPEEPGMEAQ